MAVRHQYGFTLLELLTVLLIIGIIVSFAGLSVGQHSSRTLQEEAERLHSLLRLASEEAVLQGHELALEFSREDYRFMILEGDTWQPVEDDKLLRQRELPPNVELHLELEGVPADFSDKNTPPRILVLSSSEMTPFVLTLGTDSGERYILRGGLNGKLSLSHKEAKNAV
jgi:general secretion pathway protein H